ncbi:hypothetical protein ACFQDN_09210 [Pseudomonas asuensis]|uniref:Uncharacterized protein n=1 Tax=Pseudomonas asuensis TaxID=1825787 RepID=A0ABQ2GV09_9PSED|nr:hypothetical protein [Pseudomonas asuensis]GGM13281.1 hypothetical protein GCM10009425_25340 [Pseudomonas asuensis]
MARFSLYDVARVVGPLPFLRYPFFLSVALLPETTCDTHIASRAGLQARLDHAMALGDCLCVRSIQQYGIITAIGSRKLLSLTAYPNLYLPPYVPSERKRSSQTVIS